MPVKGAQPFEPTKLLLDKGTLMDLYVGKPTFQKKLQAHDILTEGINPDAIYLGHKKLLPRRAIETLVNIEGQARHAISTRSLPFPLSGARFIYHKTLPEVIRRLRALRKEWNDAVEVLVHDYPELKEQQLRLLDEQCEELAHKELAKFGGPLRVEKEATLKLWIESQKQTNRSLYPRVEHLRGMFDFSWRIFDISSPQGAGVMSELDQETIIEAQEALKKDLQDWVKGASAAMHKSLGEAAAQAKTLLEKQGKLNPKNLKPLFDALETFNAVDFTGASDFRAVTEDIKSKFGKLDAEGNYNFDLMAAGVNGTQAAQDQFLGLINSISELAVDNIAEEAGLKSITKVGEFKRLVEM